MVERVRFGKDAEPDESAGAAPVLPAEAASPVDARCAGCHNRMVANELAVYGAVCEDCWAVRRLSRRTRTEPCRVSARDVAASATETAI